MSRWRIGSRNAAVLPLPVDAVAMRSLPAMTGGIAFSWMGVARANPLSRTAESRSGCSMKCENGILNSFLVYRIRPSHGTSAGRRVEWRMDVWYTNSGRRAQAGTGSAPGRINVAVFGEDPMGRGEGELGRGALGFRVKSGWALAIVLTGDRD